MARQPTKPASGDPVITDEVRNVADLKPDPQNARRHSEAQIAQIASSIDRFGYVDKIIIRPDGQVIGGHARVEALKRLGRDTAECRVVAGLLKALEVAMKPFAGVSVEQGTINIG